MDFVNTDLWLIAIVAVVAIVAQWYAYWRITRSFESLLRTHAELQRDMTMAVIAVKNTGAAQHLAAMHAASDPVPQNSDNDPDEVFA